MAGEKERKPGAAEKEKKGKMPAVLVAEKKGKMPAVLVAEEKEKKGKMPAVLVAVEKEKKGKMPAVLVAAEKEKKGKMPASEDSEYKISFDDEDKGDGDDEHTGDGGGDYGEGGQVDSVNSLATLNALFKPGEPVPVKIIITDLPSARQAELMLKAIEKIEGDTVVVNLNSLHQIMEAEAALLRVLNVTIKILKKSPANATAKNFLKLEAGRVLEIGRKVSEDFGARAKILYDEMVEYAARVEEPKNSAGLNELRRSVNYFLNAPVYL